MANTRKLPVAGAALIILLTVVAYIPAMRGGFIWDDNDYVTNNKALRSGDGLRQIWFNPDATVQYYPLTFTVFWAEYHLWGLHPFGFHLLNVLLQAANAILFWRLLSRLSVPGAWWAAAVFALHPVHVMSVAWITELKNVLSGCCFLAALLAYLRFCGLDDNSTIVQANRKVLYGLAVGLYLCALLAKTATSIFPVAILVILWWKKGRIGRKELVPVLPLFVMGILFGAFTLWLEKYKKGAYGQQFTLPFLERVLVAGRSFWFSLGKLVWPVQLTFIYPRWHIDATAGWQYLFPLGAIALLVTLWWARRQIGWAPLAALMYFSLAFPTLVLIQVLYMMRYTFVADHWLYLASMSIIPLCVGGVVTTLDRLHVASRRTQIVLGTIVLAALGLLTWRQGSIYQDLETLWRDTLTKNPQCQLAHNNLGNVFWREGKISDAREHYEQALRIDPDYAEAHNNLGNVFWREGKISDARGQYEQALRIDPGFAEAHYNLGGVLAQAGNIGEAIAHFEQAVRIKPDYAEAHYNLGIAFRLTGRIPEAREHLEQALRVKPDFTQAQNALARLQAGQ